MNQPSLFPTEQPSPEQIVGRALDRKPVAIFALLSGGDGSLRATHWAMNNVPDCEVAHVDTGVGIAATTDFVRETCRREGWPLTIIRAKEDCGQDYDEIVLGHGFPGPASHGIMYRRLKERCIEKLVRDRKTKRSDKVMLLTGIQRDDSTRRSGYGGAEITFKGAQMWVNHMYWRDKSETYRYLEAVGIPRNPVAYELGMSGECGCGAYSSPGELAIWKRVCPAFGARIEALQRRVHNLHPWGWEDKPPKNQPDSLGPDLFAPMCTHCLKSDKAAA